MSGPTRVLFLCTGNSARSILYEATLNHFGGGRFAAYSAGSRPTGRVHPQALAQLAASGIPTQGLRSKSWNEFAAAGTPELDLVVTVCDGAAAESCPVLPGCFVRTHWGQSDPAADADPAGAFAQAHRIVTHRVAALVALPDAAFDTAMQARLDAIGASYP